MRSPQECQAEAERCERLAAAVRFDDSRAHLLLIASHWRQLAKEADN